MRRPILVLPTTLVAAILFLAMPGTAQAAHSLQATTGRTGFLLSSTTVQVAGTLSCVGSAESGSVGVVLIQPSGGVALNGGGSTPFSCSAGETVSWVVVVMANGLSSFTTGDARFDPFAHTDCSDEGTDGPSVGIDGTLEVKQALSCFGQTATTSCAGTAEATSSTVAPGTTVWPVLPGRTPSPAWTAMI
jgi:hypothetical protein